MNSSRLLSAHGLLVLLLCFFASQTKGLFSNILIGAAIFFLCVQICIGIGLVAKKLKNKTQENTL